MAAVVAAVGLSLAMAPGGMRSPSCFARPPRAVVHMNMADRFVRLVKANVNQLISNSEDPEKILDQAVVDMQKDLVKVRQSYAEVTASGKRFKEQMRAAEDEASKWYKRAQLALEAGDEDLAREALERRRGQDELAQNLAQQLQQQESSLQGLYDAMKELEAKISEAKLKKDQYIARARTAKATTKVQDMLSDVGSSSAVAAFERMKDKVESLEAEAETTKQLSLMSGKSAPLSIEAKFKVRRPCPRSIGHAVAHRAIGRPAQSLESSSGVDDELEKLRASLPQSKRKDSLPPGSD